MSETPPVTTLVFRDLRTDNFAVCRLGNNVEISAKLLAEAIPNLVYENCALNQEKHAGAIRTGNQVWKLQYRNSLPFHVKISPPTSKKMYKGEHTGQRGGHSLRTI